MSTYYHIKFPKIPHAQPAKGCNFNSLKKGDAAALHDHGGGEKLCEHIQDHIGKEQKGHVRVISHSWLCRACGRWGTSW